MESAIESEHAVCAVGATVEALMGDTIDTWREIVTIIDITVNPNGRRVYWYNNSLGNLTFIFRENIELARVVPPSVIPEL